MTLPALEQILPEPAPGRGDPARLRALTGEYRSLERAAASVRTQLSRALLGLDPVHSQAVTALRGRLSDGADTVLRELATQSDLAASALRVYADSLLDLAVQGARVRDRTLSALHRIGVIQRALWELSPSLRSRGQLSRWDLPPLGPAPVHGAAEVQRWEQLVCEWARHRQTVSAGRIRWNQLREERQRADRRLESSLSQGTLGTMVSGHGAPYALAIFGPLLSGESLSESQAAGLLSLALSPAAVTKLWSGLDPVVRTRLLEGSHSELLGNLPGIPAADRHRANLATLRRDVRATRARMKRARAVNPEEMPPQAEERAWEALRQLATDFLVRDATALVPPVFLTSYRASGHRTTRKGWRPGAPLASLTVGDLDRASQAVYVVPGMNSSTAQYRAAVLTLRQLQREVPGAAFTYWLDYDSPGLLQEPSTELAVHGADRLKADLAGLNASRAAAHRPVQLHVIGHSYGTTTAARAIAGSDTPIRSLTLLSSAGLPPDLTHVQQLGLPSGTVTAMTASDDAIAPIGKGQRWPIPSSHPVDPQDPAFGARVMSTEPALGSGLRAPVGHDLVSPRRSSTLTIHADPSTALRDDPESRHMLSADTTTRAEILNILRSAS
ncbi:MAG: alpha/beta hydrolase family protein [Microbacteriaceae bacterium]|nr:alpha/beta hydrolase family protein [Microbacteriaceae bacterium]